ncbi:MAG: PAS domain S-box protein [Amphritea sp.]|nr:PAS domain S-box protein [Amphritea sp.]
MAQPDSQGRVLRFISQIVDQTEILRSQENMRLAAMVYENSSEAMMVTDADNRILDINPALTAITGYTLDEMLGHNPSILSSGRHDSAFYEEMWHSLKVTGSWNGEIWNKRKNGEAFAEWLTINTIYNENQDVYRRIALFSDITNKKEAEALILQQANYDSLTGLPNSRLLMENLKLEMTKAADK